LSVFREAFRVASAGLADDGLLFLVDFFMTTLHAATDLLSGVAS
jgi:hypothetical protein